MSAGTMTANPPRDPRDGIIQDYRKKVQEHQEYEARLKQGKFELFHSNIHLHS